MYLYLSKLLFCVCMTIAHNTTQKDRLLCFYDVDFQFQRWLNTQTHSGKSASFTLSTSCPKFVNPTPKPADNNNEKNSPLVLTSRDINLAHKFVFRGRPCRICFTVSVRGYVWFDHRDPQLVLCLPVTATAFPHCRVWETSRVSLGSRCSSPSLMDFLLRFQSGSSDPVENILLGFITGPGSSGCGQGLILAKQWPPSSDWFSFKWISIVPV